MMILSAEFVYYLIPAAIALVLGLILSVIASQGILSFKMMFLVVAISLSVFIVNHALPEYALGLVVLSLGVIWFGGRQ